MPRTNSNPLVKLLDYKVPKHSSNVLYMFGGIALAAFAILIITGIFIAQVYNPTPVGAHTSIANFVANVPFADFMRSSHFWAANLVIILLLFHVGRVFITGSYKKPRRLTWLTGVALLAVTIIYVFIGTALKWDQEGIEATGHMIESFELFGIHIGLTNVGVPLITQLYSWHTTVLLLVLLGLMGLHMILIKLRGISSKPDKNAVSTVTAGSGESSFLIHLQKLIGFSLIFLAAVGLLAIIFPATIGYPGILEQEVTRPLWLYWPFFGLENIFGLKGLVWGMFGFFAFLFAVPFIDRNPHLHWSKRKFILSLGFLFMVLVVGLGVYSRVTPSEAHLHGSSEATPADHDSTETPVVVDDRKTVVDEHVDEHTDDDHSTEVASADEFDLSHQRLYNEARYLVPALLAIGVMGAWLALRVKR